MARTLTEILGEWEDLPPEERQVREMRRRRFEKIGILDPYASLLADDTSIDLHRAERMHREGATPALIFEIMR